MSDFTLTDDQKKALEYLKSGKNVFLTGPGGSGKSRLIDYYCEWFLNNRPKLSTTKIDKRIAKTSTTGISALNIGGTTIHSWAGVKLGVDPVDELIKTMSPFCRDNWFNVEVLIIDEISMLNPDLFDKLNEIGKRLRHNKLPFGGIQIIGSGDGFQLPVVKCDKQFFEAETWNSTFDKVCILNSVVRQQDPVFRNVLNEVRLGYCSDESKEILLSRVGVELKNENGILPTKIYAINKKVDDINKKELNKLIDEGNESKEFKSSYKFKFNKTKQTGEQIKENIIKDTESIIPNILTLCVGAQVIFKKNLGGNIVNGTRAVVSSFTKVEKINPLAALFGQQSSEKTMITVPIVTLLNGNKITVLPVDFEFGTKSTFIIVKNQIPLKLGWATTIHGSQGMTLDYVITDIGTDVFDYGMTYVSLSRVKTLEGLSLLSFDSSKIMANPAVLEYYNKISS